MKMTKKQVEADFRTNFLPYIRDVEKQQGDGRKDSIMRREEWNNYVDMLAEDGDIPESGREWTCPVD